MSEDIKQAEHNTGDKTYYSGSDGSVGFGVPADHSGGMDTNKIDDVIDEHNKNVEDGVRFVHRYQLTKRLSQKNYVGGLYKDLMKNLKGTKLADQAESALEEFEKVRTAWTLAEAKLLKQKAAAKETIPLLREYGRSKKLYDTRPEGLQALYDEIEKGTQSIIDKYEINGWDLGDEFTGFIDNLGMAAVEGKGKNPDGAKPFMSEARDQFDRAFEQLLEIETTGGGDILTELDNARQNYNRKAEELNSIQSQMSSAWMNQNQSGSKSAYMRVLDETDTTKEESPRVPGYRLAVDTSPRVCGNCRFFKGTTGVDGECVAFDFTAKANYVCDAWQATEVTSVHTIMRDEDTRKATDEDWVNPVFASEVIEKDGTPKEILGKVGGESIEAESLITSEAYTRQNEIFSLPEEPAENAALRAQTGNYLPNDVVWSKALNSLAIVSNSITMSGTKLYGLNLVHPNGTIYGTAFSNGKDFVMRGSKATKQNNPIKSVDTESVIEHTRNVYRALESVVNDHKNWIENPLSSKEVVIPLQKQIKEILEYDDFKNVKTGPKRKYFRALQTAVTSIGAAKLILFESYKAINILRRAGKSDSTRIRDIVVSAQERAYANIDYAYNQVKDALILPSATHGDEAPGIE